MDSIPNTGMATVIAGYLVGFVKMAAPDVPSWGLVVTAVAGGVLGALLGALASARTLDPVGVAITLAEGITAAAAAAGVSRLDQAGERARGA